jgi:hypothetical protein
LLVEGSRSVLIIQDLDPGSLKTFSGRHIFSLGNSLAFLILYIFSDFVLCMKFFSGSIAANNKVNRK